MYERRFVGRCRNCGRRPHLLMPSTATAEAYGMLVPMAVQATEGRSASEWMSAPGPGSLPARLITRPGNEGGSALRSSVLELKRTHGWSTSLWRLWQRNTRGPVTGHMWAQVQRSTLLLHLAPAPQVRELGQPAACGCRRGLAGPVSGAPRTASSPSARSQRSARRSRRALRARAWHSTRCHAAGQTRVDRSGIACCISTQPGGAANCTGLPSPPIR